ncbi:ProQ/FinO family protein [Marinobacterium weihaiense]|uniref:ProQ/FinO family protein n=1 Tax=Marinobacterium weihaiense TaxID=2851016 RepID=UPI002E1BEDBF
MNQTANSKNRSKNRAANQAALEQLIEAYPLTFSRDKVRPLKIGIQEDLIADEKLARNRIKRALATYVRSLAYLRAVQEGVERVDLKGEAAGVVTAGEAEHAQGRIKEIQAQRRERQKQQRQEEQQQRQQEKEQRLNRKLEALVNLKGR